VTDQPTPTPPAAEQPAPPPPTYVAPPAPPMIAPARRTGLAAIAGVILIVLGLLGALLGLFVALVGSAVVSSVRDYLQIPDLEGADAGSIVGGFIAFVGVLVLLYSVAYLLGGIGVLRSAGWGRTLGLIVGILSGLIWLSSLSNIGAASSGSAGLGTIVMFAAHAYIVVVLLFYWKGRPSPA
jgi:hypothetical protein